MLVGGCVGCSDDCGSSATGGNNEPRQSDELLEDDDDDDEEEVALGRAPVSGVPLASGSSRDAVLGTAGAGLGCGGCIGGGPDDMPGSSSGGGSSN